MPRLARIPQLAALALVCAAGQAAADPLWQAEVRAGYGMAAGGSGAQMSMRPSPVTLAAIAALAFNDEPPMLGYGGLLVEALDRNSVGAVAGVTLAPRASRIRLSAGGAWIVAPYTLFGATASGGACMRMGTRIRLCGDLQLTAYFAGSDLAEGHTVTQVQIVAGLVFDGP